MAGLMAGQARPDHGGGERPEPRVGDRAGRRAHKAARSPSAIQGEALEKRVRPLAASLPPVDGGSAPLLIECDVAEHRVASTRASPRSPRAGRRIDYPRPCDRLLRQARTARALCRHQRGELCALTMNISVFSFTAVAQRALAMMPDGGSMLTLSYYGAEKVIPHYNVMGVAKAALETSVRYLAMDLGPDKVRVNAISAGPIKTLAASGIGDFRYILKWNEYNSPAPPQCHDRRCRRGRGVPAQSDLASGVTGEVHHVDAGYNVIGMKAEDAPDINVA